MRAALEWRRRCGRERGYLTERSQICVRRLLAAGCEGMPWGGRGRCTRRTMEPDSPQLGSLGAARRVGRSMLSAGGHPASYGDIGIPATGRRARARCWRGRRFRLRGAVTGMGSAARTLLGRTELSQAEVCPVPYCKRGENGRWEGQPESVRRPGRFFLATAAVLQGVEQTWHVLQHHNG